MYFKCFTDTMVCSNSKRKILFCLFIILLFVGSFASSQYFSDYNTYIRFHWKGGLSSHSITVKVFPYLDKLTQVSLNTFLVLYTKDSDNKIQNIRSHTVNFIQDDYPVGEISINSLYPVNHYFYTFIFSQDITITPRVFSSFYSANSIDEFEFRTLQIALKPFNFTFGTSSCSRTASTNPVFQKLADENLDFFIHMGDFHYQNIAENSTTLFYEAYYRNFAVPIQKIFYQKTPLCYIWDDHDFGPNNSDGNSPSKDAATTAFHRFAPYGDLKNYLPIDDSSVFTTSNIPTGYTDPSAYLTYNPDPFYGIFRSFIVGRCLFIMTDLRTFKEVKQGDMLGDEQKLWLENQFRYAGKTQEIKRVFFISSSPWIHNSDSTWTEWTPYKSTQEWIASLVKEHLYNNNKKFMVICGDVHMLAYDDGRNNLYGGFPVVQTGPLDQGTGPGGGPYSHCCSFFRGQYGKFQVIEQEDGVCVKFDLKYIGETKFSYNDCIPNIDENNNNATHNETNNIPVETFNNVSNEEGVSAGIICAIVFPSVFVVGGLSSVIYLKYKRSILKKLSIRKARVPVDNSNIDVTNEKIITSQAPDFTVVDNSILDVTKENINQDKIIQELIREN